MLLQVEKIVSGYKDIEVLHEVSINAKEREITCLIGPNGAGKSTLLKTIYGFLKPRHGRILFDGKDITGIEAHKCLKEGMSYLLQRRHLFPYLTVEENLRLGMWSIHDDEEKKKTIEMVDSRFPILKEKKKKRACTLSGGEQRLLELGRALMTHPQIVLLDEPSAGLAPKVSKAIYEILQNLIDEGLTFVMVDQNVRQALNIADYVYVLELGHITAEGRAKDFETDSESVIRSWFHYGGG